jgi:hypothetical protein
MRGILRAIREERPMPRARAIASALLLFAGVACSLSLIVARRRA